MSRECLRSAQIRESPGSVQARRIDAAHLACLKSGERFGDTCGQSSTLKKTSPSHAPFPAPAVATATAASAAASAAAASASASASASLCRDDRTLDKANRDTRRKGRTLEEHADRRFSMVRLLEPVIHSPACFFLASPPVVDHNRSTPPRRAKRWTPITHCFRRAGIECTAWCGGCGCRERHRSKIRGPMG